MKNWKQINSSPFKKKLTTFKSDKKNMILLYPETYIDAVIISHYLSIYQFKKMYISIRI